MQPQITTHTRTTKRIEFALTREHIIELLRQAGHDIADDAEVVFQVPGGGDYSNCEVDVDGDSPIAVRWTVTEES